MMQSKEFKTKISHAHSLIHSLTLTVVMMKSKELKTKIYSHADSQILSHTHYHLYLLL